MANRLASVYGGVQNAVNACVALDRVIVDGAYDEDVIVPLKIHVTWQVGTMLTGSWHDASGAVGTREIRNPRITPRPGGVALRITNGSGAKVIAGVDPLIQGDGTNVGIWLDGVVDPRVEANVRVVGCAIGIKDRGYSSYLVKTILDGNLIGIDAEHISVAQHFFNTLLVPEGGIGIYGRGMHHTDINSNTFTALHPSAVGYRAGLAATPHPTTGKRQNETIEFNQDKFAGFAIGRAIQIERCDGSVIEVVAAPPLTGFEESPESDAQYGVYTLDGVANPGFNTAVQTGCA